jgi:hypothetical protein
VLVEVVEELTEQLLGAFELVAERVRRMVR